jgi:succinoglycan biosynthesis transport protein ExoP
MDTIDRSDSSNLPSPFRAVPTPLPALPSRFSGDLATAPTPQISSKTLLRGLARHWWQILLVWLVVSTPVVYLIHFFVAPTFEAFSILSVSPTGNRLFEASRSEFGDFKSVTPYLQTQCNLMTSDRVLGTAINYPEVINLRTITESDQPRVDLRKAMTVEIVKDAFLIRVALELADGNQAATIVNSVVHSYLAYNGEFRRSKNSILRTNLEAQAQKFKTEAEEKHNELRALNAKGNLNVAPLAEIPVKPSNNSKDSVQAILPSISEGQSQRLASQMIDTEIEIFKLEADIKAMEDAKQMSKDNEGQPSNPDDEDREQQIIDEFRRDPEVVALNQDIALAAEQRDHAKAHARQGNDPARRASELKYKRLMTDYDKLWKLKYDEISKRLKTVILTPQTPPETIDALKNKLVSLKAQKLMQAKLFDDLKVDKKIVNSDNFEAALTQRKIDVLLQREQQVRANILQLDFETGQEDFRISPVDPAVAPKVPTNNKRIKYMAAAPIALLFMILGVFCLLEVKAERVGDPDTLSTRVRSEVYALPPLPTARAIRKLSGADADDQIEQFIQRLDHLRFALCGNPSELGKGRCLLITSAIGGEGKTTLAAQLAARCGNAGMSTLLIDADLRRAALCPLLDVPEGPGLSDVLKEDATIDEVVIPVQGGTFYLLPAGTAIQDTSRIFQNPNLGLLIARLRQLYDLIIIDSPPVLPVPDALILGRWTDGAVLAARYDISRFPQVERARRQLDNAGIAIMGTVINGMRNADSYYGRYNHRRRQPSPQPSSSDPIDS